MTGSIRVGMRHVRPHRAPVALRSSVSAYFLSGGLECCCHPQRRATRCAVVRHRRAHQCVGAAAAVRVRCAALLMLSCQRPPHFTVFIAVLGLDEASAVSLSLHHQISPFHLALDSPPLVLPALNHYLVPAVVLREGHAAACARTRGRAPQGWLHQ